MTEPTTMKPSAGDRTSAVLAHLHNGAHDPVIAVAQALDEAHRDGFAAGVQAERARIIALIRDPPDLPAAAIPSAFRALADHLEHQTATPADRGGS